ncbi:hypothetical protein BTR14_03085 [Rhizobium rhizosphaerae]|uniref:Transcriptional coactivator p15 (PC4) C-terminal domain-containing protein n=1 Tax=Xaviernesmea rhizosphaerae TaxID=1672749 RepID=A0ABX3PH69_9HYPH|nr:PC4/YdbC family ssDNA-binding protein [Xaviernesmea rhizosphaerae]OQP87569.1 hypothetical protein BTR14_03085 [Xaviernesmea rhizosphaerae]
MSDDTIIATIAKNRRETVRVTLTKFEGHDLLGLRVWFTSNDSEERPGKAGLALRVSLIPNLIQALQDAQAEAVRRGLLSKEGR